MLPPDGLRDSVSGQSVLPKSKRCTTASKRQTSNKGLALLELGPVKCQAEPLRVDVRPMASGRCEWRGKEQRTSCALAFATRGDRTNSDVS